MITLTEENYIKAIYHLGKYGKETVNTNAIAEALDTKASSVTDMVKKACRQRVSQLQKVSRCGFN